MSDQIGARIEVGDMASLDLMQTFRGSRVGDIYLKCYNLKANVEANCAAITLRAAGCGSFYPEVLWATWLQLIYALNDKPAPDLRRLLELKHNRLELEPLPAGQVACQHDDDADIDFLNVRREESGYRLWMDDLWETPYLPEGGVLLKPEHMNPGAWSPLEKIASLLHHPDFRARNKEMARRAKSINRIDDVSIAAMREYRANKKSRE
ncbi:MAG TPA: hypothetical protein VHP58_00355 [Alphaproteobacteria bacterium]|nr:hypothetical protein [Alphaproteobacteria bacterium]